MATDPDPYRTLGLSRTATLEEIKRAYRQLAKANHPDAAGEAALPRFLAIQAAYEALAGGAGPMQGRRTGSSTPGSPGPGRPREADADRGEATRRAYGGRTRSDRDGGAAAPGGTDGAPPGASAGRGPKRPGRRRTYEPRPEAGDASADPGGGGKGGSGKRATFGSTSYDGVDPGPFEPDWGGASWYGTTSGTYWTLNPKEYADPRKHGPEYQARARRSARTQAGSEATNSGATGEAGGPGAPEIPADPPVDAERTGSTGNGSASHTTTSWWDSTAGPADPADRADATELTGRRDGRPSGPWAPGSTARSPDRAAADRPPDLGRATAEILKALTDDRFDGLRGRLVRAIVGWLPIALGLGWAVGELTGCGRFAATCDGAAEPILLALQAAIFGLLLLVPAVASIAALAGLGLFIAAVAASLILSATGGAADGGSRQAALGIALVVGWCLGLVFAIGRRARTVRSPVRPVS